MATAAANNTQIIAPIYTEERLNNIPKSGDSLVFKPIAEIGQLFQAFKIAVKGALSGYPNFELEDGEQVALYLLEHPEVNDTLNKAGDQIGKFYPSDVQRTIRVYTDPEDASRKLLIVIKTDQNSTDAAKSLMNCLNEWLVDEPAFMNDKIGIINESA